MPSGTSLDGLRVLLHEVKCIFFHSRVLRDFFLYFVGVRSRVLKVFGRGGVEGRVPSLMTSPLESKVPKFYFISFTFDGRPRGGGLKRERNEV